MIVPKWLPPVLLCAVALLGLRCYGRDRETQGALRQQVKAREGVIAIMADSLAATAGRIPKVDTVAGKAKTVYVAAVVDYQHIADSIEAELKAKDEPPSPLIRACNAALAAADTALSSCARQVAVRDTALWQAGRVIGQQDSLIRTLKKIKPSRFGCVVGGTASDRGVRPGIGCGIKL